MTEEKIPLPKIDSEHIDTPQLIFSDEEVRSMVKGFISAYVKGTITVNFANAEKIKELRKAKGESIDDNSALNMEIDAKKDFVRQIQIITGRLDCTKLQFESAVNRILSYLLVWRSANRIQGTFMNYEIENKIHDLEQKLDATNNLVVELVNWLTEEAKGNDNLS